MAQYHIAQVNIARLIAPLDDPLIADFVAYLAPINALADTAPGFVWRFQTADGDATSYRAYGDDRIIVNFSVWESVEALKDFVYKGNHSEVMRKRKQWFEKMAEQYMALWWVPVGHFPTWDEAQERLESLRRHGDTPYAFSMRKIFPPEPVEVQPG
jgi:hypothetical protein